MARPKKGSEKNATLGVALRISVDLRVALDRMASKHSRSISDEMRDALEKHVAREDKRK